MHDKNIAAAVMFGRGHIETGVILQPAADIAPPADDEKKQEEYINLIWCGVILICHSVPKLTR